MKIVIVSDSHGDRDVLDRVFRDQPDADLYLHAGDACLPPDSIWPFVPVRGNCDYCSDLPESMRFDTPYGGLVIMHGHTLSAVTDSFLRRSDAKIFVSGHTHIALSRSFIGSDGETYYVLNPGSVSRPRDGETGSYLIVTAEGDGVSHRLIRLPY